MTESDQTTFSEDDYPIKFIKGASVFPPDERIFHRPGFRYDLIQSAGRGEIQDNILRLPIVYQSGQMGILSIEPVKPGVLRIQVGCLGAQFEATSPMLLPFPEEKPAALFAETDRSVTCEFAGCRLEIDRSPFCLRVRSSQGETIFESEWEKIVGMYTAPPMGLRRKSGDARRQQPGEAFLSWRMRSEDRFFGLGERFTKFEKTGSRATIWEADTCGSNTTDMSYKAVPVLFSTAGWALMLHSSCRSYWEIGSFSYSTGSMLVEDERLDLFLILAPTLKEQVQIYTGLTGRPTLPPRWAFGLWMSRTVYAEQSAMRQVADRLRREEIPCDVMHIDGTYMPRNYYNEIGVMTCDFDWSSPHWDAPEQVFAEFAEKGISICLWINPYLPEDSPLYAEARRKGYLVLNDEGGISRLEFNLAAGIVDFTNPDARAWWQAKLVDLLRKGAAVFKVDFGDRIPEDALFYNRRSGREMHNLFVHIYAETVYEAVRQVRGTGFIWRRPGYIGSQRFPGCWAGDTQVTFEGMAGALRGGLSAGFTGESFWSHDIGGFVGAKPSDELYIRWAQFGLLSPLSRFHGTTPREPWFYNAPAVDVVRHYARLRYALVPYLLAYGQESVAGGLPLMRPMVLEFPDEPRIDAIDDQYLLGPDLLVAPIFKEGARSRWVYFPKGQWWNLDRPASVIGGPGFREIDAPLERIPLFARAGAVLPFYQHPPQHLKGPVPSDWLLDIYPGDGERNLEIHEQNFTVSVHFRCENGSGRLKVSPAPISLGVRLVDRRLSFLRATQGARLQPGDEHATFRVDASQGVSVEFRS